MKQGLEVLWWKHNIIPTKGSIQQTPPRHHHHHHQTCTYPRQATHLWHTHTHTQPPSPYLLFHSKLIEPQWASGSCGLVGEAQKATAEVFTSSSPPLRLLSQESAKEREILEVLKNAKVLPCMVNTHSWHTLLFRLEWAHLEDPHFQGPLLFLKVPTGHPSVKPKAHLSLCPAF